MEHETHHPHKEKQLENPHTSTDNATKPHDLWQEVKDYFQQFRWSNLMKHIDLPTIAIVIGLIIFGLIMVFSASMYIALKNAGSGPLQVTYTQSVSIVLGFILFVVIFLIPTNFYREPNIILIVNIIMVLLLLATRFFGLEEGGAKSWLRIGGFSLQASELAKIVTVVTWIWISDYSNREFRLSKELFKNGISRRMMIIALSLLSLLLIALQPDYGMFFIIIGSICLIWLIDNASQRINMGIYGFLIIGYGLFRALASQFSEALISTEYHFFERIGIFINPFIDPANKGYQSINGYVAFSRGGFFGVGLGQGLMKRGQIPAINNDFIIANIAEEIGFVGVMLLMTVYFILFFRLLKWSAKCLNPYRSRMILGLTTILMIQTFVNVGGVMGIIPMTGVTLPLISAGGSSMIITLMTLAIILKMIFEDQYEQEILMTSEVK